MKTLTEVWWRVRDKINVNVFAALKRPQYLHSDMIMVLHELLKEENEKEEKLIQWDNAREQYWRGGVWE